jgi:hypothetical protein
MAARLQQESERSRVRGLVYHLALQHGRKESNALIEKLSADNNSDKKLLEIVHEPAARDHIEERIVERLKNIAEQSKSTPIPFNEMVRLLAEQGQDFTQMLSHYREDISQESFGGPQGALSLANMFLVREFARRPKRLNNLESMGLVAVQYPALDVISKPHPPFTLEEWRSFLKIVLDFFVRGGGTLFIDQPTRKWLGMRIPQTWLVPMDRAELDRGERRWPRAVYRLKGGDKRPNDRSLLVRLLANVLHADIETPTGEDRVDDVLRAAWKALTEETRILQAQEGGRRVLPLDALAFGSITEAWICPVTRRILDTTLRGVTPYLSNRPTNANSVCRSIELPLYDEPMGGDSGPMAQIERAREWLGNQDTIQQLTREGLWSIVNDRAIELAPYYTAAEHSAQQPSHLLDRYEREFKDGQLNLLSCSTTMEMGIDIGGISMVAMNNVPPHPANYLQRAGRAGRRREARSLSFTLCKSNPHDQIVFSNTAWPFESKLPAPSVALSSEIIVQRHINSLVLSYFLKDVVKRSGQDASKLTSGWFFASPDPSPIQQLIDMCMGDTELAHPLSEGLKQVIVGSLFAGQSPEALVRSTAAHLESVREHWMGEWEAILRQEDEFVGDPDNLALKAIRIQKQRMDGEYLLRELADQGFLPAYGFPTHIAAFENLTAHQTKQIKFNEERKGRDDNRYQRRELANRDSVTALREYAPGAQIVMNGLVYRSAGITLNWKVPASERDSKELLSIRHAWRCHHCGANGSSAAMEESLHCDECGTPTKEENRRQFMEPAGFSVDFYEDPGNDVSTQDFIPVEPPWIHAEGEWLPLPNPSLGRFRVSNRGHIFNHSGGLHGNGYAICLECGRAEPLDSDGKAKRFDNPHYKLRGEKNQDNKREPCPGSLSDWKIKRPIALGTEGYTDVLELQLANETGVWLNHNSTALTLAVALRDALAELLGVRADELSCTTKPASVDGESPRRSILIFDRYAAGYASSAERFIERLFEQAAKRLECSKECDSACPHCVLDFDQRFLADSLDRHKAKEFLTEDWLNNLSLPKELRIFGKESKMEYADLAGAIFREARASGQVTLRLFGDCREADLGLSPIRQLAYRLAASDTPVQILCEEKGFAELDETDRHLLASMADSPNISIMAIPSLPVANGGRALAEIIKSDGTAISWGVSGDDCLSMNEHWGKHRPLIVANQQNAVALHCQLIEGDALRPEPPDVGDREIEIHHELDGKLQNFGEKFWDLVRNRHPASDQLLSDSSKDVIAIRYSDRYLFTPLAVGLLVNLIEGLRDIVSAGRWASPKIEVVTTNTPSGAAKAPARTLWSNWPDLTVRNLATEAAFDYIDMQCDLHIASKMQAPHGRILELRFSTNEMLSIRLDQGVSYWRAKTTNRNRAKPTFDFHADEIEQAERLCSLNLEIEGALHPTQLFAKVDKSIA